MTIEYRMYLKFFQKPLCLGWFKPSQALWSAVKKTRLDSSKENLKAKSSPLSTKRNLSTLLNFLFPLVSFIGLFSFLKCKTLHLKATTWWTRASHFVDGWHLSPPPMWLPIWLLWGSGYGWSILGKNFFLKPLELEFFSLTNNGVSFFSALYTLWGKFFSVQDINFLWYILASFSPSKSVYRIFFNFWNHP